MTRKPTDARTRPLTPWSECPDPCRLVTIEADLSVTTVHPRLTPCQARAVYETIRAIAGANLYLDVLPAEARVVPFTRKGGVA